MSVCLATIGFSTIVTAAPPVDFTRDVQPILAEHCTACHGVDAEARESGLRLDVRADVLRGGDSGEPAIFPGEAKRGTLLSRITSSDPDLLMPPPDAQRPLSSAQIQTLTQWINEGATYSSHWAFEPPQKPSLDSSLVKHPIDVLIDTELAERGLIKTVAAESATLCRRIYLDIIGLPPSPEELRAFEHAGLQATVQMLLDSPRYGEKWGRLWLDAARYSDTNGYEKDLKREQWIWRDWVIAAFNDDMPYDQFIREQIAGDLLPNATQSQMIATGFLRNSMLNEEGAIIPEQFRMAEIIDRIDCIGKSILGLTTGCAQCHSHKFDPLSQEEYYGLFAYLNDTYEAQSWVYNAEQLQQRQSLLLALDEIDGRVKQHRPTWKSDLDAFARQLAGARSIEDRETQENHSVELSAWQPLSFHQLESISGLNHPVQLSDQSVLMLGHNSGDVFYVGTGDLQGVTGLQLEALPHRDLPFAGPGRNGFGGWDVKELEVHLKRPGSDKWERQSLINPTADFSEADTQEAEAKGKEVKKASGPVAYLIDGHDETTWRADHGRGQRNQAAVAVVQFEQPLDAPPDTEIKIVMRMGDMLGCCRVSTTRAVNPSATAVGYSAVLAARIPEKLRSGPEHRLLFAAWRKSLPELQSFNAEAETAWSHYPEALTSVMHLGQRAPEQHRATHLLLRGEWDQPQHTVEPHVPDAFHPLDASQGNDRLAFAQWLVDRRSPLAARVAVNRVWQAMFGEGLVETSEDFGTRAPAPEHREVLDWLAVDFMEHDWSHKQLISTIASSQAYQRSSDVSPAALEIDPRNRWLARGPRFRVDAEVVRDLALSLSGLITNRLGGPGVIPPVPENVLNYNYVVPTYWTPATGPERYRRTIYGFRKRSMPDPVMSSFDAPNGDFACARRPRSNTPLAALTGLNEPIFVEAAQALALRILREGGDSDLARAEYAFQLCTARHPSPAESAELVKLLSSQRARVADGWLNPRAIASGDPATLPELPQGCTPQDAAVWTLAARVLLNLDETISKN